MTARRDPGEFFSCRPVVIGSMPHTDPVAACQALLRYLPDIPTWPQLPRRSYAENMYVQYSEGLPGAHVDLEKESIYVDRSGSFDEQAEALYTAFAERDLKPFAISRSRAAGLHAFLETATGGRVAVKGQVTGPISMGLCVTDGQRYIVYDETLADVMARHLAMKAAWQEEQLRRISGRTIIFVDEPYLTSLGTSFVSLPWENVAALLEETLSGISGFRGLHCCGNTDWSQLLSLPIDILSFDTYTYVGAMGVYPKEGSDFIRAGGSIAWGIVPNEADIVAKETVASLRDRLGEAIAPLTRDGIPFKQVLQHSLLTPSCGLASLSVDAADLVLELLADLSAALRQQYSL